MALFTNSPDGILGLNPAAEQILTRSAGELEGLQLAQAGLLPTAELEVALEVLQETLRTGDPQILELEFSGNNQSHAARHHPASSV